MQEISEATRHMLLVDFNDTGAVNTLESSVISLFQKTARVHACKPALRMAGQEMSYAVLDAVSDKMAAYLDQGCGIKKGMRVGILMDRSFQMIVSTLAVLKSGAVCIPLNTAYPTERIEYILADSDAQLLLTNQRPYKGGFQTPVIAYDKSLFMDQPGSELQIPGPDDPAYIIYTSGSTGKPKGVMLSHENILDYIATFISYFKSGPSDRILHHSSLAFDTSVEEIHASLCSGALLVISAEGGQDVEKLCRLIREEQVTLISATPLLIGELNARLDAGTSLRAILSGGDELRPHNIDRLIGYSNIYNTYGPTEVTVCATYSFVKHLSEAFLIGKPISNRKIYLLNESLELLPPGETGEICISGKGLSRGYVNLPELTALKMVPNPFLEGELMLRSGDMGRWTKDGALEFLGRKDEQVKIHGFRVEPAEIENALRTDTRIKQVVVLSKEANKNRILLAFYCAESTLAENELKHLLSKSLPEYMIPSRFIRIDHLPMMPNGKLDKNTLLQMDSIHHTFEEPINKEETYLLNAWKSVLEIEDISVHDHFFESGGNSVKVVYLHTAIEEQFPGLLTIADLFNQTTIRKQAAYILEKQGHKKHEETPEIKEIEL